MSIIMKEEFNEKELSERELREKELNVTLLKEAVLNAYYANNARKLHMVVDKILLKFGGLSDMDKEDFYSIANEVFADAMRRYDNGQSFDGFLYSCLSNRIKSEMTRRNREGLWDCYPPPMEPVRFKKCCISRQGNTRMR